MYKIVRRMDKVPDIAISLAGRLIRHGHETQSDGIGAGPTMTWPDTATGIERARMYRDLLNRGKP
jgi:hypothetical protein